VIVAISHLLPFAGAGSGGAEAHAEQSSPCLAATIGVARMIGLITALPVFLGLG
jgi:hypothetical protein